MNDIQSTLKDLGIQAVNAGGSTGNRWWSGHTDRTLLQSFNPATGEAIAGAQAGKALPKDPDYPTIDAGIEGMAFIEACVTSSEKNGKWTKL